MQENDALGVVFPGLLEIGVVLVFLVDLVVDFMFDEGALEGVVVRIGDVGYIFDGEFFFVDIVVWIKKEEY